MHAVLIIEQNPFVRVGLEAVLTSAEAICVCGVFACGEEAIEHCPELQPDVVLIDQRAASLDVLPALHEHCNGVGGVLVFLECLEEQEVFDMLSAGVGGFIAKLDDPTTLCEAIRAIAEGDDVWLSPRVSKMLLPPRRRSTVRANLTKREHEVLCALAAGKSNSVIAKNHHLSAGTVRNILSVIYGKLNVKSRAAAVAWAWQNGVVKVESLPSDSAGDGSQNEHHRASWSDVSDRSG
jgi:DNA-binding NarL/FixJ family response regulator